MILLEIDQDGIVRLALRLPQEEADEGRYLDALRTIGELERPFALLVEIAGYRHLTREGEVAQAAWAKATRSHLNRMCRGLAILRENPDPRTLSSFQRFWSFPVQVTADRAGALAFLRGHLAAAG
ncbi:hypothetical protein EDC65_4563 [Stella humosa]|uniref:SpoIIAA-like protein n=1 Tax=Stella humosa TaxID=94 RepID=A0A3N1KVB7_9PROT|nr:hypothetical protein [Stella humosa]ROP83914.1 hypothetical protein EDC65_4563 [Stella humosa]BBK32824.1 hypothetical protein STHU_34580 [Stella humosa]